MIPQECVRNFDTLTHAFREQAVLLLACRDKATGAAAYVLCVAQPCGDAFEFVPLARLFEGNPDDVLEPLPPPAAAQETEPEAGQELDDYAAVLIAEGVLPASPQRQLAAWQLLVDSGLAWRLQGWFGRTAKALLDDGLIRAPRPRSPA